MENKILSLIMTMCVTMIMIIVFPSTVNAAQSGSCGYNLTWTLDNGTLTISGSGSMTDYKSASTPWDKSRSSIKAVIIENGVTSIGDYAFFLCTALTSITTGDTVTSIGKCAFYGCTSLKLITVPIGVKNIGDSAFYDCSSLTSIAIPSSILDIGESTFRNCSSLFFVEIPDSVTSIGLSAFYNCTSLASILIPDSVISIEKETFYNTAWFNNQPDGLVYAGKVAYQYKGTMPDNTEIILRDDTKGIVSEAFYGCASLASITIPDSVTNIGRDAFYGCASLTSITIPLMTVRTSQFKFFHLHDPV